MAYGFQCFGEAGNIQIDENYLNIVLMEKGVLTFNTHTNFTNLLTLSYTGESPILCLAPTSNYVAQVRTKKVGNTWTWSLVGGNGTVTYYIFDVQPDVETHAGLNVYAPDGRVAFNSEYKPMRINAIVAVTATGFPNPATQHVITGGSGNYGIVASMPSQSGGDASPIGASYTQCFRLTGGTSFDASWLATTFLPPSAGRAPGPAMIVDVGGL